MAVRPKKNDASHAEGHAPGRDRPKAIDNQAGITAAESPARALQEVLSCRLSDGFTVDQEYVERWPRRQRLLFLVGSALALWGVTIGLASLIAALID